MPQRMHRIRPAVLCLIWPQDQCSAGLQAVLDCAISSMNTAAQLITICTRAVIQPVQLTADSEHLYRQSCSGLHTQSLEEDLGLITIRQICFSAIIVGAS